GDGGQMATGDDEHVDGCLGIDVTERDRVLVLVHELRRHVARSNLAENTVVSHAGTALLPAGGVPSSSTPRRRFLLVPGQNPSSAALRAALPFGQVLDVVDDRGAPALPVPQEDAEGRIV